MKTRFTDNGFKSNFLSVRSWFRLKYNDFRPILQSVGPIPWPRLVAENQ